MKERTSGERAGKDCDSQRERIFCEQLCCTLFVHVDERADGDPTVSANAVGDVSKVDLRCSWNRN